MPLVDKEGKLSYNGPVPGTMTTHNGQVAPRDLAASEVAAMKRIGLLHHPKLPTTQALAETMAEQAQAHGLGVWIGSTWDVEAVAGEITDLDLLGTLATASMARRMGASNCDHGVSVLGVNFGRLGFLAELEPDQWIETLPRLVAGEYWLG